MWTQQKSWCQEGERSWNSDTLVMEEKGKKKKGRPIRTNPFQNRQLAEKKVSDG